MAAGNGSSVSEWCANSPSVQEGFASLIHVLMVHNFPFASQVQLVRREPHHLGTDSHPWQVLVQTEEGTIQCV